MNSTKAYSPTYYAISTINDTAAGRAGWSIYGEGQTEGEATETATDTIGGRGVAKTATEQTLYRNLLIVTAEKLSEYGLA